MTIPKVSVILPVYNWERFLNKCLDSLVLQKLEDIEIIVVNDWSTDWSQIIIDNYKEKYSEKIKVFSKKNWWISNTRNFWIKKATWEYIWFIDMDDYIDLDFFERLYNLAVEKWCDVVSGDIFIHYPNWNNKIIGVKKKNYVEYITDKTSIIINDSFIRNKIYKRNLIINNEIYFPEGRLAEDTFFTIKIIKNIVWYYKIWWYYYNRIISKRSASHSNWQKLPIDNIYCTLLALKDYDNIMLKKRLYRLLLWLYLESAAIYDITIFENEYDNILQIHWDNFLNNFIRKLSNFDKLFYIIIRNRKLRKVLCPILWFIFKIYKKYIYNWYSGIV